MAFEVHGQKVRFFPPEGAVALTGDFTDWHRSDAVPLSGAPIELEFPRNSWIEYAWVGEDGKPFADPDNPQKSLNPWWNYPRAVQVGTYELHRVLKMMNSKKDVPAGVVHRHVWEGQVFSGTRRAYVYTPPGYDAAKQYPVFYVQDGVAFFRTGRLGEIADQLIAAGQIQPAVFVFLEPNDRTVEYYLNDRYFDFLKTEVMPLIESTYAVRTDPEGRGMWGASLGGLISLYTASQHPEVFRHVVAHSGAFLAEPGRVDFDAYEAHPWLLDHLKLNPPEHLRVSLDTGTIEWLCPVNRKMASLMHELGIRHQYREHQSGHNWVTWRNAIPEAMLYILGV